jgi:hypothetical protein
VLVVHAASPPERLGLLWMAGRRHTHPGVMVCYPGTGCDCYHLIGCGHAGYDDPEVMAAVNEVARDPAAFKKHANNPKVRPMHSHGFLPCACASVWHPRRVPINTLPDW